MLVELVLDEYCFSSDVLMRMRNKLTKKFKNSKIKVIPYNSDVKRFKKFGVQILPVWLINNNVVPINPFDHDSLQYELQNTLRNKSKQ